MTTVTHDNSALTLSDYKNVFICVLVGIVTLLACFVFKFLTSVATIADKIDKHCAGDAGNKKAAKTKAKHADTSSSQKKSRKSKENLSEKQVKAKEDTWLLTTLKGHSGEIEDMDYSSNGRHLLTCANGTLMQASVFAWLNAGSGGEYYGVPTSRRASHAEVFYNNAPLYAADYEALQRDRLMSLLRYYLLPISELWQRGYPMQHDDAGQAIIMHKQYKQRSNSHDSGHSSGSDDYDDFRRMTFKDELTMQRRCVRCREQFFITPKGYLTKDCCVYHWGRVRDNAYTCCGRPGNAFGCTMAHLHVWSGLIAGANILEAFVSTQPPVDEAAAAQPGVYAVDCEMVYTHMGMELARVTIVTPDRQIVYDCFVQPENEVIDYNTRFSGITYAHLKGAKTLKEVQHDLLGFINTETILIGHGLDNDLRALKMIHQTCLDTALAFPHKMGEPFKRSLRELSATILNKEIQTSEKGHDSVEDATAAMDLMLWKVANDATNRR